MEGTVNEYLKVQIQVKRVKKLSRRLSRELEVVRTVQMEMIYIRKSTIEHLAKKELQEVVTEYLLSGMKQHLVVAERASEMAV